MNKTVIDTGRSRLELMFCDNMEYLKTIPDNYFDLAVDDPPYGIRQDGHRENNRGKLARCTKYNSALWDQPSPSVEFFTELRRVSKNQIIFGANHFIESMPYNSSCWIVWDKVNGKSDFADCELAWTSFDTSVRIFRYMWMGMNQGSYGDGTLMEGNKKLNEKRIHPTQKPVRLYDWIFTHYAKPGMKVIDPHLGSGSIAIAANKHRIDLTGCEKVEGYYQDSIKRVKEVTSQLRMT